MKKIYEKISPVLLLLAGWALIALDVAIRSSRGLDFQALNALFVLIGLAAYFLPTRLAEAGAGEALRRKILWLLLAAEVIIVTAGFISVAFQASQG